MSKEHMGSSLDDFLKEEGDFDEAQAQAIKEVVAWQRAEERGEWEQLPPQALPPTAIRDTKDGFGRR